MIASPSKTTHRLAYIDTLRGFAACWVFMLHVHAYWLANVRPKGLSPTRIFTFAAGIGGLGVDLFIVLSGFCLFYPLIRPSLKLDSRFSAVNFYHRRAYRLLPAYYAALAVATVLVLIPATQPYLVPRPVQISDILSYAFLVQTFSLNHTGSINGSFWSIALEVQLYVVFPILILLYKRWGARAIVPAGVVVACLWPALHDALVRHTGIEFDRIYHFPARWLEFIAGMLAARWVCHPEPGTGKWAALLFVLTLPATVILSTGLSAHLHLPYFTGYVSAAITFASLVVWLAGFKEEIFMRRSPVGALTRIGVISYSFYLLHQPILLLTLPFAQSIKLGILPTFALAIVTALPFTILLAYLFFIGIERPFLVRGKRPKFSAVGQPVAA